MRSLVDDYAAKYGQALLQDYYLPRWERTLLFKAVFPKIRIGHTGRKNGSVPLA